MQDTPVHLPAVECTSLDRSLDVLTDPALAPQAIWVAISAIGGFVLVFSTLLLIVTLLASHRRPASAAQTSHARGL